MWCARLWRLDNYAQAKFLTAKTTLDTGTSWLCSMKTATNATFTSFRSTRRTEMRTWNRTSIQELLRPSTTPICQKTQRHPWALCDNTTVVIWLITANNHRLRRQMHARPPRSRRAPRQRSQKAKVSLQRRPRSQLQDITRRRNNRIYNRKVSWQKDNCSSIKIRGHLRKRSTPRFPVKRSQPKTNMSKET